jgi:multicomponent Na+:H+ antiporter subunit B
MRTSIILRATARVLLPLLLVFSMFLFVRGHNDPGGGFVGGLVAAAAWALYAIAHGPAAARRDLRVDPLALIGSGLLLALASGLLGLPQTGSFMVALWGKLPLPGLGPIDIGTPVIFDLGVYLAVVGVALTMILTLAEEE